MHIFHPECGKTRQRAARKFNGAPNGAGVLTSRSRDAGGPSRLMHTAAIKKGDALMAWTSPRIIEICVGMEITSYQSAEV